MAELTPDDFMAAALAEARAAGVIGEVPIGAVVVKDGQIIGRGHNLREHAQDSTLHAEILAIQEACMTLHTWRLEDCDLYVTLEPCPMCAGAMINARVRRCFYGAKDPKAGAAGSLVDLLSDPRFNHQVQVVGGLRARDSGELLVAFFQGIRAKRKAAKQAGQSPEKQV
ncbi:tRNA adenosine(34) deaminase TadA [Lacticaseibacillus hegangensis]|uniref:tRNA-specific adenosine deaminase n=1 Tax=Lacticaseibacillus hegangensis TaxID=2486010 RepID=A0ABW4CRD3_9LACO|nr:tRNA adenosine(34) deaminase TadA [Lacticaseibacillus hegangensis]